MNCPLCKKILLEVEDGVDTDFICSERICYEEGNRSFPHFEMRHEDPFMIVRSPPYMLLVRDNYTEVCFSEGKYASNDIFVINSINKTNINKLTNDYKKLSNKIKNLIIFS